MLPKFPLNKIKAAFKAQSALEGKEKRARASKVHPLIEPFPAAPAKGDAVDQLSSAFKTLAQTTDVSTVGSESDVPMPEAFKTPIPFRIPTPTSSQPSFNTPRQSTEMPVVNNLSSPSTESDGDSEFGGGTLQRMSSSPTPTMRKSKQRLDQTTVRDVEMTDSDLDMDEEMPMTTDNHNQALHGCDFCGPDACCTTLHASDVWEANPKKSNAHFHHQREKREFRGRGDDTWESFEAKLQAAKEKVRYDDGPTHDGPFCCDKLKFDGRSSSPFITKQKQEQVLEFIKSADDPIEISYQFTDPNGCCNWHDDEVNAIDVLFKVNVVQAHEEVSTWLLTPAYPHETKQDGVKYWGIFRFDEPIGFVTPAPFEWCMFRCREHRMGFKVGMQEKRVAKDGNWESFGQEKIDIALGLPLKPQPKTAWTGDYER